MRLILVLFFILVAALKAGAQCAVEDSYPSGNANATTLVYSGQSSVGQTFTASFNGYLSRAGFYIRRAGSPTGNATAQLYNKTGTCGTNAVPSGAAIATSDNIDVSTLSTSDTVVYFTFSGVNKYALVNGTCYVIVLTFSGGDGANNIIISYDNTPAHSGNYVSFDTIWHSSALDVIFYVEACPCYLEDSYSETNVTSDRNLITGGHTGTAQSFTASYSANLDQIGFYLKKSSSATGNAVAKLYAHSGTFGTSSVPTGAALSTSYNLDVSTLTTSYQVVYLTFSTPYALVSGTHYVVSIEYSGANLIAVGYDTTSPTHAGNASGFISGSWSAFTNDDLAFYACSNTPAPTPATNTSWFMFFPGG